MSDFEEISREIQELDILLDPIANAEVDINDPNWQENLRGVEKLLDRAGLRKPIERLTMRIIALFLASNSKDRSRLRRLLLEYENFSWAMVPSESSKPEILFRDKASSYCD